MNKNKKFFYFFCLIGIGLTSGVTVGIFLHSLLWITKIREASPWLLYALPIAGFFIAWAYLYFGQDVAQGTHLIIEEINQPKNKIPLKMAPMIYLGTLLTHLFGGSAGREGTALQIGASFADHWAHRFKMFGEHRKTLLKAGVGAAFAAALGAPWAGAIFGLEVIQIGSLQKKGFKECLFTAWLAYGVVVVMKVPHILLQPVLIEWDSFETIQSFLWIIIAGLSFGALARLFIFLVHGLEKALSNIKLYGPTKTALLGFVISGTMIAEGSRRFEGLGIPVFQEALSQMADWKLPFWKILFTVLTVGSGFKGGEFIPLVFIGTTWGSALSQWLPVSLPILASCGYVAVFAAAANTPLTGTILAMELFGWSIGPFAALTCWSGYLLTGHQGIYKNQNIIRIGSKTKAEFLKTLFKK